MTIRCNVRSSVTVISNRFIDSFVPAANGEFVKVYLYLLRLAQDPVGRIGVDILADRLDSTEKDVLRALRYWEKHGWLALQYEGDQIRQIDLKDPTPESEGEESLAASASDVVSAVESVSQTMTASKAVTASASQTDVEANKEEIHAAKAEIRAIPQETMDELNREAEFSQFLFVAETYLGRPLTPKDTQLFAYLYKDLQFPEDLMEYLVEYCVGNGHRSCRYMESVALAWHQEGKRTLEQAKEAHQAYTRENKRVMKAFGITGRILNEEERSYVNRWISEYKLPLTVVEEGCNATMAAIQRPSFQYTDTILADWAQAGVRTVNDAKLRREARRQNHAAKSIPVDAGRTEAAPQGGAGKFANYQQREMDYDALLRQEGMNLYRKG